MVEWVAVVRPCLNLDAIGPAPLTTGVSRAMRPRRFNLFLPSILVACLLGTLVPTPNTTGGGAGKMLLIIFLAVAIKAAGDYILSRWSKKKHETPNDKPGD